MEHSHPQAEGGRRLLIVLALNLSITAAQIIGGLLAGSLSLLADAAHNGSDAASLGVSYLARRISGREADVKRTFGYSRAEVVGALINLTALIMIGFYLMGEAIQRFFTPQEVEGVTMLVVGVIAFVEDAISAALLYREAHGSLNLRSAMLHMVGDTLATVGVLVGSLAIILWDIYFIDPAITLLIAIYILAHGYIEIRKAIAILMDSAPEGFDFEQMIEQLKAMKGVQNVHHVHLWRLDEKRVALEAHIMVTKRTVKEIEGLKQSIKQKLRDEFGIDHATLEMEIEGLIDHEARLIQDE